MHVKSILQSKGHTVETIRSDATIADVIDTLKSHRIGVLVVTRDGRRIEGIISERDVVNGLAEHGASLLDRQVESVMTREVRTCTPEDTTTAIMELMTDGRIRHLPVEVSGRLVGIVSIGDAVKARLQELETEANHLREYISL